jgi:GNAT superfamily N-acetyltransferase
MTYAFALPSCSLSGRSVFELTAEHAPLLQRFFDDNPEYFLAVHGQAAQPNEAYEEIVEALPPGWSFTRQIRVAWQETSGRLAAMANITSDLLAPGVWHIGLFFVATERHGSGTAQALYRDIEAWAKANGASWLRLGVVLRNGRAERFWESAGYHEVRRRSGLEMGKLTNTVRVMVKPLNGGAIDAYQRLVPRDRPDSA